MSHKQYKNVQCSGVGDLTHSSLVFGAVLEKVPRGELGLDDRLVAEGEGDGGADLAARGVVERHHAVQHPVPRPEQEPDPDRRPMLPAKLDK